METIWKDRKRILGMPISFTRYRLTQDRLFLITGLLNVKEEELILYRVLDISMRRSLADRIFGVGTVVLYSADTTHPNLELKHIKRPGEVRDLLSRMIEQERRRSRVQGREMIGVGDADGEEILPDMDGDGFPG
jgi:uncharacterized membrane protein YdbT with pleckstrin-like domain